jgi:hypothetical protein
MLPQLHHGHQGELPRCPAGVPCAGLAGRAGSVLEEGPKRVPQGELRRAFGTGRTGYPASVRRDECHGLRAQ